MTSIKEGGGGDDGCRGNCNKLRTQGMFHGRQDPWCW